MRNKIITRARRERRLIRKSQRDARGILYVPVGEVALLAMEPPDELLKLPEGGVAREVALVGVTATARELRLVAVEHRSLVPS